MCGKPVSQNRQVVCSRACANKLRIRPLAERFHDNYRIGHQATCWLWRGTVHHTGRGIICDENNRQLLASRVAYELANGPIPPGMFVCHTCDNMMCVNPAHLFLGTAADNMADRDRKGRHAVGTAKKNAKLTDADVRAIRASDAPDRVLAEKFGISPALVWLVRRRRAWGHVR